MFALLKNFIQVLRKYGGIVSNNVALPTDDSKGYVL